MRLQLEEHGFRVDIATEGEETLRLIEQRRPDVVLLDVLLADMNGLDAIRRLREHLDVPVILLASKAREADRVRGLELGADDCVAKPVGIEESGARIRAVLRRSRGMQEHHRRPLIAGDIKIDLHSRQASRNGETIRLTRTEWLLLQHLAANAGRVMTHAELLAKAWGSGYSSDVQYLRVWVSRLRSKLQPDASGPPLIKTLRGIGYMLDIEPVL